MFLYFQLLIHRRRRPGCYKYLANVVRHFSRKTKPSRNFINNIDKSGSKRIICYIPSFRWSFCIYLLYLVAFHPFQILFQSKVFFVSLRAIRYTQHTIKNISRHLKGNRCHLFVFMSDHDE